MRGYKILDMDMFDKYEDMTYELYKTYKMPEEDIKLFWSGYHFFLSIEDCGQYHDLSSSRIFEINTEGRILSKPGSSLRCVCSKLTLVREISQEEIKEHLSKVEDDNDRNIKLLKIAYGIDLDKYINDHDDIVRSMVADQGYGLDKLLLDESPFVRAAIAGQGYALDILVNDEDYFVRKAVAKQGYKLDVLVNDENFYVRKEVAKLGCGLSVLINDECWNVRDEVAKQGYRLDILINDKNIYVATTAKEKLEEIKKL